MLMDIVAFCDQILKKLDDIADPIKSELQSVHIPSLEHQKLLAGKLEAINLSKTIIKETCRQLLGAYDELEERKPIY